MRTTLTLDPDVAALLKETVRSRESSLKEVVNEALREALPRLGKSASGRRSYRIRPVSLGRCLGGSLDDAAGVLAVAEKDRFR